ncbi:MAG TPA: helix-hairpin-helix domain-containing protein [Candidatus Acidoferrales bacterium]
MLDASPSRGEFAANKRMRLITFFSNIILIGAILAAAVLLAPGPSLAAKKTWPAHPIAINQATVEQLTQLPGVGPVLARRIVEFRTKHGPFRRLEEMLAIQGVSRKKFESWKPHLRLD